MSSIDQDYKYKNKTIAIILVILATVGILFFVYQAKKINKNLEEQITYTSKLIKKDFQHKITQVKQEYIVKMDSMLTSHGIGEAFFNQDREKLFNLTNKFYKQFKNNDKFLKIMTFRLTDGSTFLRVHKPEMFGDKLNKRRTIIIDSNKYKKIIFGFEIGKLKMSYRIVTPIFYRGEHIGVVEVGILPERFTDDLTDLFKINNALLVNTEDISVSLKKIKYEEKNKYSLVNDTKLMKNIFKTINLDENYVNFIQENTHYIIHTNLNLLNHKDEIKAKVLLSQNVTKFKDRYNKFIIETVVVAIIIFIFLYIILNKSFNQYIKQLSKSKLELEEVNKGLEKAVNEKTKELHQLNATLEQKVTNAISELEVQNEIIMEQTKMASLGEMIGNIAHQWRQPLSAISSAASGVLIQKEIDMLDDDYLDKSLSGIVSNTQFLSQTIDDFRNFLSADKKISTFKVSTAIDKTLSVMSSSIMNHKLTIVKNYCENEITIKSYENELTQALLNVVANDKEALDAHVQCNELKLIKIDVFKKDDHMIIAVQDNASGIPEDIVHKVLEPYFTTKHQSQGIGIGLYMTHQIINDHMQGEMNIQNTTFKHNGKVYSGALFTISLPLELKQ